MQQGISLAKVIIDFGGASCLGALSLGPLVLFPIKKQESCTMVCGICDVTVMGDRFE